MTFDEIIDELRPLADQLLKTNDRGMTPDALILKSFIFLFMGLADQCSEEQRAELIKKVVVHAEALWIDIDLFRPES